MILNNGSVIGNHSSWSSKITPPPLWIKPSQKMLFSKAPTLTLSLILFGKVVVIVHCQTGTMSDCLATLSVYVFPPHSFLRAKFNKFYSSSFLFILVTLSLACQLAFAPVVLIIITRVASHLARSDTPSITCIVASLSCSDTPT